VAVRRLMDGRSNLKEAMAVVPRPLTNVLQETEDSQRNRAGINIVGKRATEDIYP